MASQTSSSDFLSTVYSTSFRSAFRNLLLSDIVEVMPMLQRYFGYHDKFNAYI